MPPNTLSPPFYPKNSLKLFHELKNVFKFFTLYPLYHPHFNENWLSPLKSLHQQPSDVGHTHFFSLLSFPILELLLDWDSVSSFGTCGTLPCHSLLTAFTHQSPHWSSSIASCPIILINLLIYIPHALSLTLILVDFHFCRALTPSLHSVISCCCFRNCDQKQNQTLEAKGRAKLSPYFLPMGCLMNQNILNDMLTRSSKPKIGYTQFTYT